MKAKEKDCRLGNFVCSVSIFSHIFNRSPKGKNINIYHWYIMPQVGGCELMYILGISWALIHCSELEIARTDSFLLSLPFFLFIFIFSRDNQSGMLITLRSRGDEQGKSVVTSKIC